MANLQTLQDLATLFAANQQANAQQDIGPKMIVAGGRVMGRDVSKPSGMQNAMTSLGSLATNFIRMQQLQKRNQFFGEVNKVMGSAADVEEKKNLMRQLITQNGGEDYGLGIKDALWKDFVKPEGSMTIQANQSVPEGMEIIGYDQKGKPMIRKIKRDVSGEKLDLQKEEKKKVQEAKTQMVMDSAQDTLNTISEVEKGINYFGLTGGLPSIPGTARKNWEVNVNKLLSGKIINLMTSMKEASKTGATGFGQLSEKELKVLQEASTALKRGLSSKDAQKYLNEMKKAAQKIMGQEAQSNSDIRSQYNTLRSQGMSAEEAKRKLGL